MIRIDQLKLALDQEEGDLLAAAAKVLRLPPSAIRDRHIYKKAVDARKKQDVHFVCSHWESEQQMLLLGFVARATKGDFTLSEEINAAKWVPAAEALNLVYPEGNITHTLLAKYLQR